MNIKNKLDSKLEAYQGRFIYEFDNQIQMNWYPKRIINYSEKSASAIELGLGHGITTDLFSKYFEKYTVIDASPAVINNFRKGFPNCEVNIIDGYFETFKSDEKFDIIIMGFVLEHVDNPDVVLEHYKQFLAPGGKIFVTVPNAEVLNRRLGHITGDLPDILKLSDHDHVCGHQRYYTLKTITDQINSHGYSFDQL